MNKASDSVYELTIASFEKEDEGVFRCYARNRFGESEDIAYIESEVDSSFSFRTKSSENSEQNDLPGNPRVAIKSMGSIEEGNSVELNCNLEDYNKNVNYYSWAKYPKLPESSHLDGNRLQITKFNGKEDNGLYTCRATTSDGDYQKTKLIASNEYLLSQNPYFKIQKEEDDTILIKCRPELDYTGSIEWQQPVGISESSYKIEGSELMLNKNDFAEHTFVCLLKSDAELGSTKLGLEVTRELFDRALNDQNKNIEVTGEKEVGEGDNAEVECTPGEENC